MVTTPSVSAGDGVRRYMSGVAPLPGILSGMCSALLPLSRDVAASASRLGSDGCGSVPALYQHHMGFIEVRVSGAGPEIDSPVPIVVVHENSTETGLRASQCRATIR
jgi:hypothetical protein